MMIYVKNANFSFEFFFLELIPKGDFFDNNPIEYDHNNHISNKHDKYMYFE